MQKISAYRIIVVANLYAKTKILPSKKGIDIRARAGQMCPVEIIKIKAEIIAANNARTVATFWDSGALE